MKIIPVVIISTFVTLAIVGTTYAHSRKHNSEEFVTRVTEKLSLSEEQQTHLQALVTEKKALKTERKAKYSVEKTDKDHNDKEHKGKDHDRKGPFSEVFEKETISVDDINSAIDAAHAKKRERRQALIASFVTFYNSLSAEQREKAQPMLKRMLSKSKKKRSKKGKSGKDGENEQHKHSS